MNGKSRPFRARSQLRRIERPAQNGCGKSVWRKEVVRGIVIAFIILCIAYVILGIAVSLFVLQSTWFWAALVFLILPIATVWRFASRRRANAMIEYIYQAVRLAHPLAESLQIAGAAETGTLAVRLLVIAELLHRGKTLSESLTLASPEMNRRDIAIIADAEKTGQLPAALEYLKSERALWFPTEEINQPYMGYLLLLAVVIPLFIMGLLAFILPKMGKIFHSYSIPMPLSFLSNPHLLPWLGPILFVVIALFALLEASFLYKSLSFRAYRRRWTAWFGDCVRWYAPIVRSLERSRSWATAAQVLARGIEQGAELRTVITSAAQAGINGAARKKLLAWKAALEQGSPLAAAARTAHLPRLFCDMLSTGDGATLVAGLDCLHGWYRWRCTRLADMIRGAFIPLFVLVSGAAVAMVALIIWLPYTSLMRFMETRGPY